MSNVDEQCDPFGAIDRFCREQFSDVYTGLVEDPDRMTCLIYRTHGGIFDDTLINRFPEIRFEFRETTRSERQLAAAARQIVADSDFWRDRGLQIHSIGPQPTGEVLVETTTPELAADLLPARYPDVPLDIRKGGPVRPA